jgi:uncharacterized protein YcbX
MLRDVVVSALWRYPVKSLAGERLEEVEVDARGVRDDRRWALVDEHGKIASGKDTRRFRKLPGLLLHSSSLVDGAPALSAPLETLAPGWRLVEETGTPHHDDSPIHLVTTRTLASLEIPQERLRPNLVLEAPCADEELVGRTLEIGAVTLRVTIRTERCVMVTHAQQGLPHRPRLLKQIGPYAGVYADVLTPGRLAVGQAVHVRSWGP